MDNLESGVLLFGFIIDDNARYYSGSGSGHYTGCAKWVVNTLAS